MPKKKYYVVWKGKTPGIYTSWNDCFMQTKGFKDAIYKSFDSQEKAEIAFTSSPYKYIGKQNEQPISKQNPSIASIYSRLLPAISFESLAVDAACSGNPGNMEYRGVYIRTGKEIFHFGPMLGTNNIGEFLAIVHGLALLKQKNSEMPIYSDSKIALNWVKQKQCKTKLERNAQTEQLFQYIERAEKWLRENSYKTRLLKWETKEWGEIPADFGRK